MDTVEIAHTKMTSKHAQLFTKWHAIYQWEAGDLPVELVQVKTTGEVCRQYKGVTDAL